LPSAAQQHGEAAGKTLTLYGTAFHNRRTHRGRTAVPMRHALKPGGDMMTAHPLGRAALLTFAVALSLPAAAQQITFMTGPQGG